MGAKIKDKIYKGRKIKNEKDRKRRNLWWKKIQENLWKGKEWENERIIQKRKKIKEEKKGWLIRRWRRGDLRWKDEENKI